MPRNNSWSNASQPRDGTHNSSTPSEADRKGSSHGAQKSSLFNAFYTSDKSSSSFLQKSSSEASTPIDGDEYNLAAMLSLDDVTLFAARPPREPRRDPRPHLPSPSSSSAEDEVDEVERMGVEAIINMKNATLVQMTPSLPTRKDSTTAFHRQARGETGSQSRLSQSKKRHGSQGSSGSIRKQNVSFKDNIETVLDGPSSLTSSVNSVEFRNPSIRERCHERALTAKEVLESMEMRKNHTLTVAFIDEDAVSEPLLAPYGFEVRVWAVDQDEEDRRRRSRCGKLVPATGAPVARTLADGTASTCSSCEFAPSAPSQHPREVDDDEKVQFDQYRYMYTFDETRSRPSGNADTNSIVLGRLQCEWVNGHNVTLLLGNSKTKNTASLGVARSFVSNALLQTEQKASPEDWAEVTLQMGEVLEDRERDRDGGGVHVTDLLLARDGADAAAATRDKPVVLKRSLLTGVSLTGLSALTVPTSDKEQVTRAMTRGFLRRTGGTPSASPVSSFSGTARQPSSSGLLFAHLTLKKVTYAVPEEAAASEAGPTAPGPEVCVSSLTILFFASEYQLLRNCMPDLHDSVARGRLLARGSSGLLESRESFVRGLLCTSFRDRTYVSLCLSLSDYDSTSCGWMRVAMLCRSIVNKTPHTGQLHSLQRFMRMRQKELEKKQKSPSASREYVKNEKMLRALAELLTNPKSPVPTV